MGAGFCNFNRLGWDTQTPLSPHLLQEQHILRSNKVGRADEGGSSNRPELVTLIECLDSHEVDINLLYLTKLQRRVQAGAVTLLVKVKDHRGDPLNEEADIRAV